MTETDARNTLLVRAWEIARPATPSWSDEDRAWASRAAAEVEGENASSDAFIARRAQLAAERLAVRDRASARALRAMTWRPWIGWVVALLAFLLGVATDSVGSVHRINVLAPPLLALMGWNLIVYVAIAMRTTLATFQRFSGKAGRSGQALRRLSGPFSRLLARAAHLATTPSRIGRRTTSPAARGADSQGVDPQAEASPLRRFASDWAIASAHLNATRIARLLHVGAILFALGALAGMYSRGLVFEYRAGWESTFLDATRLRGVLDFVLGPASLLTGIGLPDAARLEAMRFPETAGESAAPWIHLYAVTVALIVILPRLVLAGIDAIVERRLAVHFPIGLDDAYFAALTRSHRREAAAVTVVPYNHQPAPQAVLALRAMLESAMGPALELTVASVVAYGDEETAGAELASKPAPALVVALFSATATPEPETHGDFIDTLSAALPGDVPLLALIDESAFVSRFGSDLTAARRLEERRQAWQRVLTESERQPLFVDLQRAEGPALARRVREALDRASEAAAAPGPR